ncbi:hypothetical protein GCK72_017846 [Caenorhabditis remanei]|uniref:Uncharacterized protein n=1 Tax=Caenorhabditis remanei TaxID=31234 RepID=A0A6A5G9R5_CAERE|nr:hypothetical protein GCK72_017846 [Caenorhabditis remanei]KAF1751292.1 hypothetical protein GCK72_017846 [Caenorhabditis remanei]
MLELIYIPPLLCLLYFLLRRFVLENFYVESSGKYVLITGCDSGFGRRLAIQLLDKRVNVFAACFTQQGISSLQNEWNLIKGAKGHLYTIQLDVTNQASVDAAKQFVVKVLDEQKAKLWGLVNNAGIFSIHGPDDWCSVDEYSTSLNVNTLGAVRMCHAFVPLVKKSRGRVVTMGSTAGRLHGLYVAPYVTAKFAVEAYMDCLRLEMRQYGVSVHILEPGCFKTELLNQDAQRMRIQRIWNNLSAETKEEYGEDYRRNFETAWESGVNVVANPNIGWVVDCYSHALFSWWPRLRYCPGWDAIFMFIPLSVFPTALQDWILAGLYRLSPGPSLTPAVLVKNKKRRTPVQWIQFLSQLAIIPLLYTIFFVKNTQKQTVETAHPHNVTVTE